MSKEEFIKNIVDNLTIRKKEGFNSTFYDHEGHTVFEYNPEFDALWVSWHYVWSIFADEYLMEYTDIQQFIKRTVVEALNLGDVTPHDDVPSWSSPLWKP